MSINKTNNHVTIKLLDQENWKIVKEVNIVSTSQYGVEITIGVIIYDRKITSDYKLNDDPEPNQIKRLLTYPKQDLFTHDELDELILNAVKSKFPKSFVRSYQVLWDSDEKRFNYLLKRPSEKAILEVRPDFSNVDIYSLRDRSFPCFYKEVNIYQEYTLESIRSNFFTTNCDFERSKDFIADLNKIVFK